MYMYITYAILGGVSPDQPKLDTTYCSHIRFNMFFSLITMWSMRSMCSKIKVTGIIYELFCLYLQETSQHPTIFQVPKGRPKTLNKNWAFQTRKGQNHTDEADKIPRHQFWARILWESAVLSTIGFPRLWIDEVTSTHKMKYNPK